MSPFSLFPIEVFYSYSASGMFSDSSNVGNIQWSRSHLMFLSMGKVITIPSSRTHLHLAKCSWRPALALCAFFPFLSLRLHLLRRRLNHDCFQGENKTFWRLSACRHSSVDPCRGFRAWEVCWRRSIPSAPCSNIFSSLSSAFLPLPLPHSYSLFLAPMLDFASFMLPHSSSLSPEWLLFSH